MIFSPSSNTDYADVSACPEAFWGYIWPTVNHGEQPMGSKWSAIRHSGLKECCNGQNVGQPRKREAQKKGMSKKYPKMSKNCPKNVQKLPRGAKNAIFGFFLDNFAYLVDAFAW